MKIKLAILEKDANYLKRIVQVFSSKYVDKLEMYSFTDYDVALKTVEDAKIDVLIANDAFDIDVKKLPERCGFAYLVESADIDSIRNELAICKFQKVDLIYKQILSVYSEKSSNITGIHFEENDSAKLIAFLSPAGGTGCSTAAAAYSMNLAARGKKVLFMNFEKFGSTDVFFSGEGTGDFSDIIYAIKSKKGNISLKLESTVRQDMSGVFYYSSTKNSLDMAELNVGEIKKLLTDLRLFGGYEYIILDIDFSLDKDTVEILKECNRIVVVADGSSVSNNKIERAYEALNILEQQNDYKLLLKSGILFNRVSSHTSNKPNLPDIKEFGGIKRYEGYTVDKLLKELAALSVFSALD